MSLKSATQWLALAAGTALLAFLAPAQAQQAAASAFAADTAALTRAPHRLTGTPEGQAAADYVAGRLRTLLGDDSRVIEQDFGTAQTRTRQCELSVGGRSLPLLPARPNGLLAPVTPPEGLTGELCYAGDGSLEAFGKTPPAGRIVVLDYAASGNWLNAFRLGARAVIFVASPEARAWQSLHSDANANLPRFYYEGPAADLPSGQPATIRSQVVWEPAAGRNVYAWFPGTAPVYQLAQEEVVLVAANLDSFGEVPERSPGARGAANCAALLQLAEALQAQPPRRHVLLAWFDGQARGHLGAAAFYRAIAESSRTLDLDQRIGQAAAERSSLEGLLALLDRPEPLAAASLRRQELYQLLKPTAAEHVLELMHALTQARMDLARLPAEASEQEKKQRQERIAHLEQEKRDWNGARRALARERVTVSEIETLLRERDENDPGAMACRVEDCQRVALNEVHAHLAARLREVVFEQGALAADARLRDLLSPPPGPDGQKRPPGGVVLHVSLLLGDRTSRWGVIVGGDSMFHSWKDSPGLYTRVQAAFLDTARALQQEQRLPGSFALESVDGSLSSSRVLWAVPMLFHSGEIAGRCGVYNLTLGTVQEDLAREGTPGDIVANLDLARLEQQGREVGGVLKAVLDAPGLSLRRGIEMDGLFVTPEYTGSGFRGSIVMARSRGSAMPNKPMPHTLIRLSRHQDRNSYYPMPYQPVKAYGFENWQLQVANQDGAYGYGPMPTPANAMDAFAVAFDERGQVEYASLLGLERKSDERLNLVAVRHGAVVLPPQIRPSQAVILDGDTNSRLDPWRSWFDTYDGVAAWFAEEKIDSVKLFSTGAVVVLNNGPRRQLGAEPEKADASGGNIGSGLPIDRTWEFPAASAYAATDLWRLDETRLALMRSRGVSNRSIEELHGRAGDLLLAAAATPSVAAKDAGQTMAFLAQVPVYSAIRQGLDDLVYAVLILLVLSVPFAFALERLLIGSPNVYRQIAGFAAFFALTFVLLFCTHPAFAMSKTPIIIFLGFTTVLLAGLVIFIIMRKFEMELRILQGMESTIHAADVSRFGTIMAAMSMGISSMRRRPLRTVLSAATVTLLTFTILCFASFSKETGTVRLLIGPTPGYASASLHLVNWGKLPEGLLSILRNRWPNQATVCPRYWSSPSSITAPGLLVTRPDGSAPVAVRGVLGLHGLELAARPDLAALLGTRAAAAVADGVWLTRAVADRVQAAPGQELLLGGCRVKLAGILDPVQVAAAKDLGDTDILPVDFTQVSSTEPRADTAMEAGQEENWQSLPVDSVVIVGTATAQRLGASLRAVNIYTANVEQAVDIGEELARSFPIPVEATRQNGVYRHILGARMEASGAADLFFPILLGGLVIFGTLLGSVADREKEIYTFSALGLAPPHVAGLFFTETLVYAVLGGLGGYLLAQSSLKGLELLASYGLVRVPEMNYSSTNAIVTILLVMATVLVSAIYPAIKASRSANPGVMRSWKVAPPQGDVHEIVFPFTVSEYDLTGVVSFLKEHFDMFSDVGLGRFMARQARVVKEGDRVGVQTHLALAPFDLGVTEDFELRSAPSEIPGIDEVWIRLVRRSGQPKDWRRLNQVLLDDLRRQFLIWRSLPQETMEQYRLRTLTLLGQAEDPQPTTPPNPEA